MAAAVAAATAVAAASSSVEAREGEVAPMEDLVLEPPALAAGGGRVGREEGGGHRSGDGDVEGGSAAGRETGSVVALDGVEQHLDHVLEALVRVRGLVMPRSRCVGCPCGRLCDVRPCLFFFFFFLLF